MNIRPVREEDIEQVIGLFLNALPMRISNALSVANKTAVFA